MKVVYSDEFYYKKLDFLNRTYLILFTEGPPF